jgi:hypothetical protein
MQHSSCDTVLVRRRADAERRTKKGLVMRRLLLGLGAFAALGAATPALAQNYGYPPGTTYGYWYGYDAPAGAQAQVNGRRARAAAPSSPYILGGRPYRGTDPDTFVRDYMRNDPLGAND